MSAVSETSKQYDKRQEETLQLWQDIASQAGIAARHLGHDSPKDGFAHPKVEVEEVALRYVGHFGSEVIFLGSDGGLWTSRMIESEVPKGLEPRTEIDVTALRVLLQHLRHMTS